MSKFSGDTARAHRLRKQNIRRRAKIQVLRAEIAETLAARAAAAPAAPVAAK